MLQAALDGQLLLLDEVLKRFWLEACAAGPVTQERPSGPPGRHSFP